MPDSVTVGICKPGPRTHDAKHIATELTTGKTNSCKTNTSQITPQMLAEGWTTQAAVRTRRGGRGTFLL